MTSTHGPLNTLVALSLLALPAAGSAAGDSTRRDISTTAVEQLPGGAGNAIAGAVANVLDDVAKINRNRLALKLRVQKLEKNLRALEQQYRQVNVMPIREVVQLSPAAASERNGAAPEKANSARQGGAGIQLQRELSAEAVTPRLQFDGALATTLSSMALAAAAEDFARTFEPAGIEVLPFASSPAIESLQPEISPAPSGASQPVESPQSIAATDAGAAVQPAESAQAGAEPEMVESVMDDSLAMNEDMLNEMRGGFITSDGLQISFGIERALYVNGNLVTLTSLNVADLSKLVSSIVNPQQPVVTTVTLPAAAAEAISQAQAGAVAQQIAASNAAAAPAAQTASPTAAVAAAASPAASANNTAVSPASTNTLAIIQSGSGNALQTGLLAPGAIGTIVQNTLNNQKIQSVTTVNASVNSMEVVKSLNLQNLINDAIANSIRR